MNPGDRRGAHEENLSTSMAQPRIVRTPTLDTLNPFKEEAADEDDPKVISDEVQSSIADPKYSQFSKVLLSERSRVLAPPHLSDWAQVDCCFPSPLHTNPAESNLGRTYVNNDTTILVDIVSDALRTCVSREFIRAGPRKMLAFHPASQVNACIVTCGGLCPGLNTVVRELVITLSRMYGVKNIFGIPFGYRGFYSTDSALIPLDVSKVQYVHHEGGTIIGSSRGGHDTKLICDAIQSYGFNQVYIIGGDGTHRGALKIFQELKRRKARVSVCGIPKTIDNDIALIDKSFGFDTAVEEAQRAIKCAQVEARSAINGIGLVKLMGRHSGQIAMFATLASREVDCCLIPEVKFVLDGPRGLFEYILNKLNSKKHMTIVIAEGAGLDLLSEEKLNWSIDASGNAKPPCIGLWLKDKINQHFKSLDFEINLKLIDPTYEIRSVPANASDNLHCGLLSQSAVHGAMAGFSGFSVGLINTHFVLLPIEEICRRGRTKVDVNSRMWHRVIATSRQPRLDGLQDSYSNKSSSASNKSSDSTEDLNGAPNQGSKLESIKV